MYVLQYKACLLTACKAVKRHVMITSLMQSCTQQEGRRRTCIQWACQPYPCVSR